MTWLDRTVTDPTLVDSLEELAFATVGMTALALNEAGHAKELTLAQWRVLVVLGRGPMRVGAIAERVGASLPSASRLVARMEAHGYLVAAPDEHDRRATLVSLAPLGWSTRDGVIRRRRRLIGELVGDERTLTGSNLSEGLAVLAERFSQFA
jgi:DNA-binding MarR family transcriptional regulator